MEEFAKNYPNNLEVLEKGKYVNKKKEKERQTKIAEDKKI